MRELQTMTFPLLVLCLFCFVLRLNNAALLCGGRGYKNEFGICVCGSNYHGVNCEFYYCPFGPSWFGLPVKSEARNISVAPCSDMGFCNIHTGECECRPGYEGRACERISCATSTFQYPYERIITTITIDGNSTKTVPLSATSALMCSGHGVCKTLREAAAEFNGLTSVNPSMSYNNWDADRIQGCLCDYGWEGYDCSLKSCPAGRDPTDPFLKYSKEETFFLQCQANEGYFAIMVLGKFTDPIPYDADPAYLQHALEAIPNVGKVSVSTPANTGSFPQICGSSSVTTTTIQFMSRFGSLPPILVTRNVTTSRVWPQASPLSLGGASPVLRFKTTYTMSCPACSSCDGSVYLAYKTSLSQAVDVTAANGTGLITLAVLSLEDLYRTNWPDLQFRVAYSGASNRVCNGGSSTSISIELFSSIGNIDGLTVVDASTANITLSSNKGSGNVYECSNQGICDHSTGICSCTKLQLDGNYMYRALSSDGRQSLGSRGDCGYLDPPLTSCVISNEDACNGKGLCLNDTMTCSCYQDWYGLTCNLKTCPKGPALFDEPILPNSAHRLAECSGNGHCNRQSGFCDCRPGFSGKACQIRDCPQDSAGIVCSGHGSCASIAEIYGFFGYSYGSVDDAYVGNGRNTWDALLWNECLCFAAAHLTERRWPTYYPVGPSISISGTYGSSEPIPGWEGWDCSRRRCRVGQDTRTGYTSVLEVQRVACLESKTAAFYFQLKIFDELSDPIYAYYGAHEIKQVIEAMASIGNVTVWFPYFSVDGINTACNETLNSTLGGFYVRFDTEFGNIPQMQPSGPLQKQVTVHEVQAGVNTLAECSGTSLGVCINGVCSCNRQQFSSNGVDAEGSSGDCSFLFPYARSDDRFLRFSST